MVQLAPTRQHTVHPAVTTYDNQEKKSTCRGTCLHWSLSMFCPCSIRLVLSSLVEVKVSEIARGSFAPWADVYLLESCVAHFRQASSKVSSCTSWNRAPLMMKGFCCCKAANRMGQSFLPDHGTSGTGRMLLRIVFP